MAANYTEGETEGKFDRHHLSPRHHHHQGPSPRTAPRRSFSSTSSSSVCSQGAPKCVCAPATHANSFKCRLHRAPSNPTSPTAAHSKPPPAVSNDAAHRTVEAQ